MKDRKGFTHRIGNFLAGKGFYVVLFICTAVIGVSAWVLLSAGNAIDNASDAGGAAGTSQSSQEAMASSNSNIGAALTTDAMDSSASPAVSPAKPSADAKASPSPAAKDTATPNKAASDGEGDSEEAMAKKVVFIWPLTGDIEVIYSVDELLYNKTMADWRTHNGIDIAGQLGTKVMAAADGTVTSVKVDDMLGTTVVIDHGNGLKSIYANLAKTPVVKEGDKVAMGAVIGAVGDTAIGEAGQASHLHFAITQGDLPMDPNKYLPEK